VKRLVVIIAIVVAAQRADAYPQFQLSKDQTCSSCHLSPAGGGLLNENGLNTADAISQWSTKPELLYGAVRTPSWLELGGDFRSAIGYINTAPGDHLVWFPMQLDLYASAAWRQFRVYLTGGYRPDVYDYPSGSSNGSIFNSTVQPPWSREHYVMWHDDPGSPDGVFVRVGRFMPVFGLRFAEHTDYTRRFGGTQLYAETYGAAIEYVARQVETHLTGFVDDPLIDTVEHANGAALYSEVRLGSTTAVGAEAMYAASTDDRKLRAGMTGKHYLVGPDVLIQGELQVVDQQIPRGNADGTTASNVGLVGYVLGSWFAAKAVMVDVGVGYYNENVNVHGVYRNQFDVNVHWFIESHMETALIMRYEPNDPRTKDDTGAYALLMLHFRL
jgi:hypothetical protein